MARFCLAAMLPHRRRLRPTDVSAPISALAAAVAAWTAADLEREFRIDPLFLLVATTCAP